MNKWLRQSLLLLLLLGIAVGSIAHDSFNPHEASDCSICLYQPNSDLHSASAQQAIQLEPLVGEQPTRIIYRLVPQTIIAPYQGRAPPKV